ncbi:glutamate/aspartate ABC transporter substrate-binding protein [Burkholderia multivorans]|uniref:glutamate/aspartate ABC transporter substrate-binding protein n=1 Tax=Burkholderia multivorans TaxID=87883 RepID=UPI003B984A8D|nr:glutamate/aspartate ABC transporter substrate-binding protein [Burkholderia multivorans]MCO8638046.1 glutamate/aspartate ABC transporter substrate-binding protein [Burkholderia multivorans]MCO8646199.1 glutamate/aspartate ABC transporter substrate-binding protein [Burkholderia multivorans]
MNIVRRIFNAVLMGTSLLASCHVFADDLGPTLTKINNAGVIVVGHREASIPFSYYDSSQQVIGFSQDLCQQVIDAVKTRLNKPNLAVRMIPVNSQNRIPLLQNGTIDIECGVTTNTNARHAQVAFSDTIFLALTRLLVNKDSGIKDFDDLKGKTVVTNAGTTAEAIIRRMNVEKHLGMNIISAKDYGESFLILQTGRAQAFMLDDVLLSGARSTARNPGDWIVTGTPQSKEPYAFMVRKDDPQFKALVDGTLSKLMISGEVLGLYGKWFQKPTPPKGMNFDFPMTPQLRDLYAHPDDHAAY